MYRAELSAYAPAPGQTVPVAYSIDGGPVVVGTADLISTSGTADSIGFSQVTGLTNGPGLTRTLTIWLGDPSAQTTVGLPKQFNAGANGGHASVFTVYGTWSCSPVGYTPEQAQQRATEHLLTFEEARVERAFWTGDLDNEPSLKGATDLGGGGSASITAGVSILEDYIASTYGSLGVIHMTRGAALAGLAADVLTVTDGKLVTKLGTPVVAGAGYPGTGPAGEAPGGGFTWAYATPAIFGYKSDVFTSSSVPGDLLDREQNDMYAVAERNYLLGFDPCGVATVRLALL
jgi:hypothetical protein